MPTTPARRAGRRRAGRVLFQPSELPGDAIAAGRDISWHGRRAALEGPRGGHNAPAATQCSHNFQLEPAPSVGDVPRARAPARRRGIPNSASSGRCRPACPRHRARTPSISATMLTPPMIMRRGHPRNLTRRARIGTLRRTTMGGRDCARADGALASSASSVRFVARSGTVAGSRLSPEASRPG